MIWGYQITYRRHRAPSITTQPSLHSVTAKMRRKETKKSQSLFKPGNKLQKRRWADPKTVPEDQTTWSKRLKKDEFEIITKTGPDGYSYTIPDADGVPGNVKLLRPKAASPDLATTYADTPEENDEEMRLLSKGKTIHMINRSVFDHSTHSPCDKLNIYVHREVKKGLCWSWTLACSNCSFISEQYKLYREVPTPLKRPGCKAAAPNRGIQVGLKQSTIGPTKARLIIAATNTPPPSRRGMQKASRLVGDIMTDVNKKDMTAQVEKIKDVNRSRGLSEDNKINIQVDGVYNSYRMGSRRKPGQNASQVIGLAREDMTDQHKIVGMHMSNKLCWTGAYLKGKGYKVTCPGGHVNCTANTAQDKPLGETEFGYEIGKSLAEQEIYIKHVTSDGDGRSTTSIEQAQKEFLDEKWVVTRLADRNHRAQCQYRAGERAEFSETMFPTSTVAKKKVYQQAFSADLKNRCALISEALHRICLGDTKKIEKRLPVIVDNILVCYDGDCRRCRYTLTMCGGGKTTSWWWRSKDLRSVGLSRGDINMDQQDYDLTKDLMKMQLSASAVQEMKLHTNTQACEGANRAITASLPKNVKFSRDALPRVSAAVHRLNQKMANSMHIMLEAAGAPITKGSRTARTLKNIQDECEYSKQYQKRPAVKRRKAYVQKSRAISYMHNKLQKMEQTDYCKDQLEKVPCVTRKACPPRGDHIYADESGRKKKKTNQQGVKRVTRKRKPPQL